VFVGWVAFGGLALVLSAQVPDTETVPFHIALAVFALAYTRYHWAIRLTVVSLATFYVLAAALFLRGAMVGALNWTEALEVPITALLVTGVVWQVNRTQQALELVEAAAQRSRDESRDRERLTRLTSHEMRTPLTVVMGFLDLAFATGVSKDVREYLAASFEEVEGLNRVVDRMVRAAHVREEVELSTVEVGPLLKGICSRWQAVAERRWLVDADELVITASRERLVAGLDTLVENAIRYTTRGETVRLIGLRQGDWLLLGVADGGQGLPPGLRETVDERVSPGAPTAAPPADEYVGGAWYDDPDAGTGLGLEIVRRSSHLRGGILVADRAPEGGAVVAMWIPVEPPSEPLVADGAWRSASMVVPDPSPLLRRASTATEPAPWRGRPAAWASAPSAADEPEPRRPASRPTGGLESQGVRGG
jgi:signal transduction histidine kinase